MSGKPTRAEQILKLAGASPGIKTADAASILGMSSSALSQQVSKLRKEGKLKKTRGTLELADGASADAVEEAGKPAKAKSGKKAKKKKQPPVAEEDQQLVGQLIREGVRRAEAYRQEGLLTNIVVAATADGQMKIQGAMGGGGLVATMMGAPEREMLDDPGFQQYMAGHVANIAGGSGHAAVFYNLTDIGGDDEPMQALVCAWVGGRRVTCAIASLEDGPINVQGAWKDLTDKQAEKLFHKQREEALEAMAESEDGSAGGTMMRQLGEHDLSQVGAQMSAVMGDDERAPVLMFSMNEETAPAQQHSTADEVQMTIDVACEKAQEKIDAGQPANFTLMLTDTGDVKYGETAEPGAQLPVMTGLLGDEMSSFIKRVAGDGGVAAVFVNMTDLGSEDRDLVVLSAWQGNELVCAMNALHDGGSLLRGSPAWQEVSAEELLAVGRAATGDSETPPPGATTGDGQGPAPLTREQIEQQAEQAELLDLTPQVMEMGPLPAGVDQMPGDLGPRIKALMPMNQVLIVAGKEPGIKYSKAAKFLGLPKKEVKEIAEKLTRGNLLEPARNTLTLNRKFDSQPQSGGGQPAPAPNGDNPGVQAGELVKEACRIVESERQDGQRTNFILIGKSDGSFIRAQMGEGQIVPIMSGLMGDQLAGFIEQLGQGDGQMAVFVSMDDLQAASEDGSGPGPIEFALLSAWIGNSLMVAMMSPIGAGPMDDPSENWMVLNEGQLRKLGQDAQANQQAAN